MACAHFPSWSQPKEWTIKEVYLAKSAHSLLFMHNSTLNKLSTMTQMAFSVDLLLLYFFRVLEMLKSEASTIFSKDNFKVKMWI